MGTNEQERATEQCARPGGTAQPAPRVTPRVCVAAKATLHSQARPLRIHSTGTSKPRLKVKWVQWPHG